MLSRPEATYASIPAADREAFARAVSPNPYAPELVDRVGRDIAADRWWAPMIDGGRYLELGCGIAGRMLTLLQAMPMLRAVGVELDSHLAEEARRRAKDLGLQDRVEIVTADATVYRADEPFDFGFWSQWFFPSATRDAALASLFANVRSGGVVRSPVFGDHQRMAAEPYGSDARHLRPRSRHARLLGRPPAHARAVADGVRGSRVRRRHCRARRDHACHLRAPTVMPMPARLRRQLTDLSLPTAAGRPRAPQRSAPSDSTHRSSILSNPSLHRAEELACRRQLARPSRRHGTRSARCVEP